MNRVLNHYLTKITTNPSFNIIRLCASRHPLGSILFYGNHGLRRLANHTPTKPLDDLNAEHLLHLWLTVEYIRLSDVKAMQRSVDLYKLNDLWATILHDRTPALTTVADITNYTKTSIMQHCPQFSYDNALLTIIAEAVIEVFTKPFTQVALQPVTPATPTHNQSLTDLIEDMLRYRSVRPVRREQDDPQHRGFFERRHSSMWDDVSADAESAEAYDQHLAEFRELDNETRYNDTDSWENPHGDYD